MESSMNIQHVENIELTTSTSSSPLKSPQKTLSTFKGKICQNYRKGKCPLKAKKCPYSHGVIDLEFKSSDLEKAKSMLTIKESDFIQKKDKKTKETQKNEDPFKRDNYINLFEYQHKLLEQGLIKELVKQKTIDKQKNIRQNIKEHFKRHLHHDIVNLILQVANSNHLSTNLLKKCFITIDLEFTSKVVFDNTSFTEIKFKSESFTVKLPDKAEYEQTINNQIIEIIKEDKLIENLPIATVVLNKHYHKYFAKINNPFIPSLVSYLKSSNTKLEDHLLKLEKDDDFKKNLAIACNKDVNGLLRATIFEDKAKYQEKFMEQIEEVLLKNINNSEIGLFNHKECEDEILTTCNEFITLFNKNHVFMKRLIKILGMKKNTLVFNFMSDSYMLSFEKLKFFNCSKFIGRQTCAVKPIKVVNSRLFEREIQPFIIPESERWDPNTIDKVIDSEKIVFVNDDHTLEIARESLQNATDVAVDLEGALCVGGIIELIQIECNGIIFVFDLFGTRKKACVSGNINSDECQTYVSLLHLIKEVMENPSICKVFHDGRKDSLALHLFSFCCPQNTFDTGAIYMFIEQLKRYLKFKDDLSLSNLDEELKQNEKKKTKEIDEKLLLTIGLELERVGPPGINDVLKNYNASHGPHLLKDLMHERFGVVKRDYFLQRPIDKEFLLYAAKDVEDLVEVKYKMLDTLEELFKNISGKINRETINLLCNTISGTYTAYGCCKND